jgi:ribosomal protein L14E/L6E/L27E
VKVLEANYLLGRVVYSTAGRDCGKAFIILKEVDENYVLISNGKLRKVDKPKKKKIKHLTVTKTVAEEIRELLLSGDGVTNSMIVRFLQLNDANKEV